MFFMSESFNVASADNNEDDEVGSGNGDDNDAHTNVDSSSAVGAPTSPTHILTSTSTSAFSSTRSEPATSATLSTESHSNQTNSPLGPKTSIPSTTQQPSSTESAPTQQETGKSQSPSISKGLIAGIVTAVVLYAVGFTGLIGFICCYRLGLLKKMGLSVSGEKDKSIMDGRYQKAELDCQGHEVNVTRRYELDATREVQEADGKERPAELDAS